MKKILKYYCHFDLFSDEEFIIIIIKLHDSTNNCISTPERRQNTHIITIEMKKQKFEKTTNKSA